MSCQSRILRRAYTGNLSLRTTDHAKTTSLLSKFSPSTAKVCQNGSKLENGLFLCELENVLFPQECAEIVRRAHECIFENMSDKYRFGKQRSSSRLLAIDKSLAENVWQNIKPVLSKEFEDLGITKRPLGFDVSRGEWELHNLNEGIRISKYSGEKKEFFSPHKDAQYCPSGDERSLLTLLVYLNEDFQGGETCFYFPKDITKSTKGMTTKEEIESVGGLAKGYDCVKIVPKMSHAVLFSQNILHESVPVVGGTKYILKTDVVVKRYSKQFGFAVVEREKEDYLTCLNYFREAQQQELKEKFDRASDLYEKALSIRYCYPACLERASNDQPVTEDKIASAWRFLPLEMWQNIFKYLPGYDAQNLVYAYPALNAAKECWEQQEYNNVQKLSNKRFIPKINYHNATLTCFEFPDAGYFWKNATACCRVAAMYSFFLLGHRENDDIYTVRYNPDTQDVCAVALRTLLSDVFHNRKCYGSFYTVCQQSPKLKDAKKDFEASVDRNYMLLRHGAEFVGVELQDGMYVKSTAYLEQRDIDCQFDYYYKSDSEDTVQETALVDELCDGSIPISGKRYPLHRLLRKYILMREENHEDDIMLFMPKGATVSYSERERYWDMPVHKIYHQGLERILDSKSNVSCLLVSKLKQRLSFERGHTACPYDFPSFEILKYVADACVTECYNHLVFDFEKAQLSVECCGSACPEQSVLGGLLHDFVGESQNDLYLEKAEEMCYKVNIEPILSNDTSFNHAACQCHHPRFDVHEYCNIRHYPYVNHVFLVAREVDGRMLVWSAYGGIVAL